MGYIKTAQKRYFVEVMGAVAVVVAVTLSRPHWTQWTSSPALLFALKLLPPLGVLFIAAAVWRLYRARDERDRLTMLKTGAAAMLLSVVFFMLYPFLHMLGAPALPPAIPAAPLVLAGSAVLCGLVFSFLDKRAEAGTRGALIHIAPWLLVMLALAGWWILAPVLGLPAMTLRQGLLCICVVIAGLSFYRIFMRPADQ
jgi:hypothetical protein